MLYGEFMGTLAKGTLKSLYLLTGQETYLRNKMKRRLLDKLLPEGDEDGVKRLSSDITLAELKNEVYNVPFFTAKNILILREWKLLRDKKNDGGERAASDDAAIVELFADLPDYTVLILEMNSLDKRRKLYKAIAQYGCCAEADPVKAWELQDWLNQKLRDIGRQFDREAHEWFMDVVGVMESISLAMLDAELDKLALYTDEKIITKPLLHKVWSAMPEVSSFAILDAVGDKNLAKALALLQEQRQSGVHPLKILALLNRYVTQLWQVKVLASQGYDAKRIAAECGIKEFVGKKLIPKCRKFAEPSLRAALTAIAQADYDLKTGRADQAELERIVIDLCGRYK